MYNKNDAIKVIKILKNYYPDAKCSLDFSTPFEMVVATILSAQCTDDRVNKTTPSIFPYYSTPKDFAEIDIQELEFGCTSKLSHFPISNSGLYLFIFSLSSLFFAFRSLFSA